MKIFSSHESSPISLLGGGGPTTVPPWAADFEPTFPTQFLLEHHRGHSLTGKSNHSQITKSGRRLCRKEKLHFCSVGFLPLMIADKQYVTRFSFASIVLTVLINIWYPTPSKSSFCFRMCNREVRVSDHGEIISLATMPE